MLLGRADSFAVLAGTTVTNTGSSVITGDVGVFPGSSITGFPPGSVNGTIHTTDTAAGVAQIDLAAAYTTIALRAGAVDKSGTDLGGLTLMAGVYKFTSAAQLTGALTLSGPGEFDFQIGSTLTTASGSKVLLINGADSCNIFWQVGSSATLGTTTAFEGNILALTSITLNNGANILDGRALARNGAVTLDTNNIDNRCVHSAAAVPVPGSFTLLGLGLASLWAFRKKAGAILGAVTLAR